jgi:hypothetical protein
VAIRHKATCKHPADADVNLAPSEKPFEAPKWPASVLMQNEPRVSLPADCGLAAFEMCNLLVIQK